MEVLPVSYLPGDPLLIDKIVCELKSQGIFDSFRKECIADVDTKPAYLNLRQRVEGSVTGFLKKQQWNPDMNKNQLREALRKNIHESGFLETGVERIVDQVVNPKMTSVFLPKVTDVVYKYLGIACPTMNEHHKRAGVSIDNLLPEDLEAVSPESDRMNEGSVNLDEDDDVKMDEDESPPFEPIDEANHEDNNSMDSHLSGFSGLISHDSNQSEGQRPLQIDMDTQMSKQSSDGHSILNDDQNSKMEIGDDSNLSKTFETGESDKNSNSKSYESEKTSENDSSVKPEELENSELTENETTSENNNVKLDQSEEDVCKTNGVMKQLEADSDKSSSSIKDGKDKEKKEKDNKDKKDRDRHRSSDKHKSRSSDKKSDRRDKDKYSSKDRDRKDSRSRSDKDKEKDRHRSSSKHDKSSSSSSRKDSSSSSSKTKTESKDKHSSKSKSASSSSGKSDRHRTSSSSKSKDKDKKDKKYSKDDHYSSKHKSERRSTDRDSNDGSGLKSSSSSYCESNSSSQNSASQAGKAQDSSNSNSNDSGNSDSHEVLCRDVRQGKLIKPKIASNIEEAKRLMKIRKELKKIEQQTSKEENQPKGRKQIKRDNKCTDDEDEDGRKYGKVRKGGRKGNFAHPEMKKNCKVVNLQDEESEIMAAKEFESPKPVTPPLNRSVSMASWDAMEAMLNQNVNYDSYYDPEYMDDVNTERVECKNVNVVEECRGQIEHVQINECKEMFQQSETCTKEECYEDDHNENVSEQNVSQCETSQNSDEKPNWTDDEENKNLHDDNSENGENFENLQTNASFLEDSSTKEETNETNISTVSVYDDCESPKKSAEESDQQMEARNFDDTENQTEDDNLKFSKSNEVIGDDKSTLSGNVECSENQSEDIMKVTKHEIEGSTETTDHSELETVKIDLKDTEGFKITEQSDEDENKHNSSIDETNEAESKSISVQNKLSEECDNFHSSNTNENKSLHSEENDLTNFSPESIANLKINFKTFLKHFTLLRKEISEMEMNIELNLCNNMPTTVTDVVSVNKENVERRRGGIKRRSSSTIGCESTRKIKNNNNFIEATQPEEKFPLPLSPSDSDKSVERRTEHDGPERKVKSQRYTSEDLYKPRPAIRLTSRRSRTKLD